MIKITRFFYIHILVFPMIAMAFFLGSPITFFITYGIVLIHELSHLITAMLLGVSVRCMILMPFGMTLRLSTKLVREPKKEVLIAAAGPFSNLLMLLCVPLFSSSGTLNTMLFVTANVAILLLNLLPVPPLDGGRMFRAIMIHCRGLIPAAKFIRRLSAFLTVLLALIGIWLLFMFRGNISLIMVDAFLIYSLVSEKQNSDILAMQMLIYEKELLHTDGFIPSARLTMHQNAPLKRILRKLNFSTFYIITVLDDTLSVCAHITESDIIRTITQKGYTATLTDCIKTTKDTPEPTKAIYPCNRK